MTVPLDGPDSDGARSYSLATRALREHMVRAGTWPPNGSSYEARWAEEGPRPWAELDTVRNGENNGLSGVS